MQLKATKMEINCGWNKKNGERYLRWMVVIGAFFFIQTETHVEFFFIRLLFLFRLPFRRLNCAVSLSFFLCLFFRSGVSLLKVCDDVVDAGVIVWPSCMHDGNGPNADNTHKMNAPA